MLIEIEEAIDNINNTDDLNDSKMDDIQSTIKTLENKIKINDEHKRHLHNDYNNYKARISNLNSLISTKDGEKDGVRKELTKIESEIEKLENRLKAQNKELFTI